MARYGEIIYCKECKYYYLLQDPGTLIDGARGCRYWEDKLKLNNTMNISPWDHCSRAKYKEEKK